MVVTTLKTHRIRPSTAESNVKMDLQIQILSNLHFLYSSKTSHNAKGVALLKKIKNKRLYYILLYDDCDEIILSILYSEF